MNTELTSHNPDANQRNVALACHLLGFIGFVFPFGHILGPLVLWLVKRDGQPFIDDHGKEALNFQISFTLWFTLGGVIAVLLIWTVVVPVLIGIGMFVLALVWLVTLITAAVRASNGETYRYPFTLRLVA